MIQVKRLGRANFETPDLERIVDYWTRIIGLTVVDRNKSGAIVVATKYGEEAIAVEAGDSAGLLRATYQVAPGTELADVQKALAQHGVKSEVRSDVSPGVAKAVVFTDPKNTVVEVYSDYQLRQARHRRAGHHAAQVRSPGLPRARSRQGHGLLPDVLGFKVSDWMGDRF